MLHYGPSGYPQQFMLTGRSFETLHIQKQLSEAQMILSDIMKSLK